MPTPYPLIIRIDFFDSFSTDVVPSCLFQYFRPSSPSPNISLDTITPHNNLLLSFLLSHGYFSFLKSL